MASEAYDKEYNPDIKANYKNQISFCSKFLHFQAPNNFFIIDHYTEEGSKRLFSAQCRNSARLYHTLIDNSVRAIFSKKLQSSVDASKCNININDLMIDYVKHVKRSYALGCILKEIEKNTQ